MPPSTHLQHPSIFKHHPQKNHFQTQDSSASVLVHHQNQTGLQATPTQDNVHVKWALGSLSASPGSPQAMKNYCGHLRLYTPLTPVTLKPKLKLEKGSTHRLWGLILPGVTSLI